MMRFELFPAALAGAISAGPMMMSRKAMMRAGGVDLKMNVVRMWGSLLGLHGIKMMVGGLIMHLVVSAGIGVMYALGFRVLGARNHMLEWGIFGGLVHWLVAGGMVLRMMPEMHPAVPERMPAPGPFARNFGTPDIVGFFLGHLVYGLAFAFIYRYLHSRPTTPRELLHLARMR